MIASDFHNWNIGQGPAWGGDNRNNLAAGVMLRKEADRPHRGHSEHPQRHVQPFDFVSHDKFDTNNLISARKLSYVADVPWCRHTTSPARLKAGCAHRDRNGKEMLWLAPPRASFSAQVTCFRCGSPIRSCECLGRKG